MPHPGTPLEPAAGDDAIVLADRMGRIEPSGIRKIFELMSSVQNPINLSIGQAHFDPPAELVEAACRALRAGKNRYTLTQGLPEFNTRLLDMVEARYGARPESCLLTVGVSGGIVLSFLSLLNPGDEILLPDPGFMMYRNVAAIAGATVRHYNTYPDRDGDRFRIDPDEIERMIGPRTKILFLNSPSNPTGMVLTEEETDALARIAERTGVWLVSDEIYDFFTYDQPFVSPVGRTERVLQLGGFSKTYGVPGWRMGYVTGPAKVLDAMKTLQQFTFVCAPTPFQHALLEVGFDVDLSAHLRDYRHKRDNLVARLDSRFALSKPEGSFYAFPRLPRGMDGDGFMQAALQRKLLVVPGKYFSSRDTHFRLSFAADDATLDRGIVALNDLIADVG